MNMRENSTNKVLITIENDENIPSQNSQLNFILTVCTKCAFEYYFFFRLCLHFLGSHVLFTEFANMKYGKCNFKTGSHGTIHIFKNYFVTVFLVISFHFLTINSILTDPNNLSSLSSPPHQAFHTGPHK